MSHMGVLSFAFLDTSHHALAVDIDRLQVDRFRYPQSRRVAGRQNGPRLEVLHRPTVLAPKRISFHSPKPEPESRSSPDAAAHGWRYCGCSSDSVVAGD